jgi:catechol 2,3-dioxygenase-like lactoylglutathione lyase family enzyme
MNLLHLHLHVRDRAAAEDFYAHWFGMSVARRGASLTFMTDDAGFELALKDDSDPARMPSWFHFGYRLASGPAVSELYGRMEKASVPLLKELYADSSLVSFRCADPDGYAIEIYWEAPGAPLD